MTGARHNPAAEQGENACKGGAHKLYCDVLQSGVDVEKGWQEVVKKSAEIKANEFQPSAGSPDPHHRDTSNQDVEDARAARAAKVASLSEQKTVNCFFPNIEDEAAMFRNAGIGLCDAEVKEVAAAVRDLAHSLPQLNYIRFWGKMNGTNADYYIAEGQFPGEGIKDDDEDCDVRGVNSNKYTYWYSHNLSGGWTQLADVNPDRLVQTRSINKMLSGDPDAYVIANPWFNGKEKHYLRCLIARISAATVVVPAGAFEQDEETGQLVATEDFAMPAVADVASADAWVHARNYLLKNGRTIYRDLGEEPNEEEQAAQDAEKEECPEIALLTGIGEDMPQNEDGASMAWSIRAIGDPSQYSFGDATKQYGVVAVKSNTWPGAATVFSESQGYASIYIGNGTKKGAPAFGPLVPAAFMDEPADDVERPEPFPLEEENMSDGGDEAPAEEE